MSKEYEPFRERFRECNKNGTAFKEKCHWCGKQLIMCKKFGGFCHSGKCRHERVPEGE